MASRTKLVVGAAGQDGKLLTEDLISKGFPVVGVGRADVTIFASDGAVEEIAPRPANLSPLLRELDPDQIYYLAANHRSAQNARVTESSRDGFHHFYTNNVNAYAQFLDSIEEAGIDPDIFFAGSSQVFEGNSDVRLDESSGFWPRGYYGMAKAQGIWLGQKFREERGLRVFSGILFNHESYLRGSDFFTARVISGAIQISEGASMRLNLGSLDGSVDWGYAKDFVAAFQKILGSHKPSDFLVATGEKNSPRLFVDLVFRVFNLDWSRYVIENPNAFRGRSNLGDADVSKIKRVTGWKPSYTFEQFVLRLTKDHLEAYRRGKDAPRQCGGD